ncbi:MAG: cadherin repeat domain-containing protein, partial [Chloroflexi bacterium]|nr:cadherin repeat domain-containing protein [Chloroflexota bacterium]
VDPLSITTASLPDGTVGAAYSQTLQASGGTTPYVWGISSGALPDGFTIDVSTGVISGTPTAEGTFSFTVEVKDSSNPKLSASKSLSIVIVAPPAP